MRNPLTGRRLAAYLRSYNFLGFTLGVSLACLSFTPSLLPRGWLLQGILAGVLFCVGYVIGLLASFIVRQFRREPAADTKAALKKAVLAALLLTFAAALLLGLRWQQQADQLVGLPPRSNGTVLGTILALVLTIVSIVAFARVIARLYHWVRRKTLRFIPRRLAVVAASVLTALLVVGVLNGIVFNYLREAVNQAFSVNNGTTESGVTKPAVVELSGSPQSLIGWDSLGRQGRTFISDGQDVQSISQFTGTVATQPVRVYAGLESAPDTVARADVAVRDLERAGGFGRRVLVVATTTGTGWIDEQGIEGLEHMHNGNTAIVSMQYSYLPSWLSFLVDKSKAQEAGIELYDAVLARWLRLPAGQRPQLVLFGESLGSFGGESAFTGWSAFQATAGGAVWAGPPNFNHLWGKASANREPASPEILPLVDQGRTVRYAAKGADFKKAPIEQWQAPRAAYLQNASDPIVWWSPRLVFNKPDWLDEARGADVSPAMRWLPLVTFWQVTGDMVFSTSVPDNHGHKYGTMPTEAWSHVAPSDGWTAGDTARLRQFLAEQGP